MKKSFVTLFPHTCNVHLMKDVGCIPYIMYKDYGYDSTIATFKNDSYPYLDQYVKGLKIQFLPDGNERIACIKYVIENAKKIDVLNMYHLSIGKSLLCLWLYKLLNKQGVSYLKLDLDFRTLKIIEEYNCIKKYALRLMSKKVDIISAESTAIAERIEHILNHTVEYIPNGVLEYDKAFIRADLNEQKKDVFLTVGRLGTEQKATENLLQAFAEIQENTDWNLWLVGKCEEKFKIYFNEFLKEKPYLKERIKLFGEITDKNKLSDIYKQCRIFVLPSKWEGFALVNVEAMLHGCRLLLSDQVSPANDFKQLGCFCQIVEFGDIKQLADEMLNMSKTTVDANQIAKVAVDNFLWTRIGGRINDTIKGK